MTILYHGDTYEGGYIAPYDLVWAPTPEKAPQVTNTDPQKGATEVPRGTHPTATFSTDIDPSTITAANIELERDSKTKQTWVSVAHTVSYDAASKTATVTPGSGSLAASKRGRHSAGGTGQSLKITFRVSRELRYL